jgi:DNA segregation ATPase FtsK/SpoIIIE, S-DNA-T family
MLDTMGTDNLQRLLPLEVVWCPPSGGCCDVVIDVDTTATVGQLRAALDGRAGDLQIDGRTWPASASLADTGLRRGAAIAVPGAHATALPGDAVVELAVVAGLLAGRRYPLGPGSFVAGRSSDCDIVLPSPSVSARHAVVAVGRDGTVTITDLESTNGSRVDGAFSDGATPVPPTALLQLGAVMLAVRPPVAGLETAGPVPHRRPDGTTAFNRPPRAPLPSPPAPVRLPEAPREAAPRARLAWAAMLAPLVLGVAMAVFYDPRFALFALFSPAMMLGTWAEDRRRARRDAREGTTKITEDIAELRGQLDRVAAEQRVVARTVLGDTAGAVARIPTGRLWERREGQADFLRVTAGVGTIAWTPPVVEPQQGAAAEVTREVDAHTLLTDAPVGLELTGGSVTGVCGNRSPAVALLRSLVLQVAANHGPADVRIAVLTEADRAHEWDWVKWLPHSAGRFGAAAGRQIATTPEQIAEVIAQVSDGAPGVAVTLVVVDADGLTQGREAPVRGLLGASGCATLVYAAGVAQLPSVCTTVIAVDGEDGKARCSHPSGAPGCDDLLLAGTEVAVAREAALAMAAIDDPEISDGDGQLPQRVSQLELLGLRTPTADGLAARWARGTAPVVPIGVAEDGPMVLDLAADGPHGLIAGTTGAGKSELLRSIVAGLAATLSPDDLTFVLIDYKGGSAFDVCAQLPHTVGLVTDLDEQLGSRALHCLEAELRHRERVLRSAGASDLDEYRDQLHSGDLPPMPLLLVAVDEFATLAAELPDFIDRLVSIAQRGRSLGVHLLLATQRPAGAVSDNIRANTNLRIALRVQDAADSADVIGSNAAAELTRRLPGRGYVRLGPGETVGFQAALITGSATADAPPVAVRPCGAGLSVAAAPPAGTGELTDLQLLVRAAQEAFVVSGSPAPRRPWPEPLPTDLDMTQMSQLAPATPGTIGLADDPDHQRQVPFTFDPARGNLLLYGVTGSGPTTALGTIALALADRSDVDCYAVDAGSQALAPLAELPNVGAVVRAGERERAERLVRMLADELAQRRAQVAATGALGPDAATIVVLLDNYAAFVAAFDDVAGLAVLDSFARIVADGPALGIVTVASADRSTAVPPATAATIAQRLVFRLSDRHDYGTFGLRPADVGDLPDGRAVDVVSGLHVQIAAPAGSLAAAVAETAGRVQRPQPPRAVGVMPERVSVSDVLDAADLCGDDWLLPLGIGDCALAPAGLRLGPGDHALITGPARSGKSTALLTVAATLAKHRPDVRLVAVALRRSPLRDAPSVDTVATTDAEYAELITQLAADPGPVVLLVDDADATDDAGQVLAQLLAERRDDLRVIGAGRADALRTAYGHWTAELRRSRQGLTLRPNIDLDGDLWHTPLPRATRGGFPAGRGYLIADGAAELLQVATP